MTISIRLTLNSGKNITLPSQNFNFSNDHYFYDYVIDTTLESKHFETSNIDQIDIINLDTNKIIYTKYL